jgi:hypothetical protein
MKKIKSFVPYNIGTYVRTFTLNERMAGLTLFLTEYLIEFSVQAKFYYFINFLSYFHIFVIKNIGLSRL